MQVRTLGVFARDLGLVLASFVVLVALENLAVGFGFQSEFASSWEMRSARYYVSPIALVLATPTAISLVLLARLAVGRRASAVGFVGFIAGVALAIGVSNGRRMASLAVRVPFVLGLSAAFAWGAYVGAKRLPRLSGRAALALGGAVSAVAWLADAFALPRLYPAFHVALFFVTLMAWGWAALALRSGTAARVLGPLGLLVGIGAAVWSPKAAARVRTEDNLRRVLLERAPVGPAVILANRVAPPPPIDDDATATTLLTSLREGTGHALDWRGHDIVLVTIDALRADHLSSYGYARKTTPNIDALAAEGARFEHAYCPTPHTSYSIASMMTGKYMKPLLAVGQSDASETWAVALRRYGYRTAAFFPPAVFFIDEHRFRRMKAEGFGFEYRKEEFTTPELRRAQVERYLATAPKDKPLFLWVHVFEPHEPYEAHPEFPFTGEPRFDAYDSEIATADALVGQIVAAVRKERAPGTVFIVSADHGEEHGDHGGRYHGTTVYEEQVRVPLVIAAPGVVPHVVTLPVQTIDLLPTSLAALDVPVPPRLRGRDLGRALAAREAPSEEGLAFAETDDYTLVARGADRLVCARKIGSCTLFDVAKDPPEQHPISGRPERVLELRKIGGAIARETGKIEASELPDALRRGLQGDRDAAEDVAALLDDARADIRQKAARCAFRLRAPEMIPQLARAEAHDDDAAVRTWSALALARLAQGPGPRMEAAARLLEHGSADERDAAALALAEHGDARGESTLVARWTATYGSGDGELDDARELLASLAKIRSRTAVAPLCRALGDVRFRPYIVEALGAIGDGRAKQPLLHAFAEERYLHLRDVEAHALLALGVRDAMLPTLTRFAGTPEPMATAIEVVRDAGFLTAEHGGWAASKASSDITVRLSLSRPGPARLLVLGMGGPVEVSIDGVAKAVAAVGGRVSEARLGIVATREVAAHVTAPEGVVGLWLVPLEDELPLPPKEAWDAGAEVDETMDAAP